MKAFFAIVLLAMFAMSCSSPMYYINTIDYPPIDEIPADPWLWVSENIEYTDDFPVENTASPERTYWTKKGDCEDIALLLMYFMRESGEGTDLAVVELKTHPGSGHAVIKTASGEFLEAQIYNKKYLASDFIKIYSVWAYEFFLSTSS